MLKECNSVEVYERISWILMRSVSCKECNSVEVYGWISWILVRSVFMVNCSQMDGVTNLALPRSVYGLISWILVRSVFIVVYFDSIDMSRCRRYKTHACNQMQEIVQMDGVTTQCGSIDAKIFFLCLFSLQE